MKKEKILINGIEVEGYGFFYDGGKFYIAETEEDCRKMVDLGYGDLCPLCDLEEVYKMQFDEYSFINTVNLTQLARQFDPFPTFEMIDIKEEILMNCIRLAREINKFGDYVFYHYSPHVKLNEFRFFLNGWTDENCIRDFSVNIYEEQDFSEYELYNKKGQPNTVEELETMLKDWLKDFQS